MCVPFHDDGIISQFEGYEQLAELDWDAYRARYGDIRRLDRILEAEGDTANRYKVSKQADVLMLFYLLSADELRELLERLGYRLDRDADPADRRLLPGPHLARLDAERGRARLGAGPVRTRPPPGGSSWRRWTATCTTSRAARPVRASTSAPRYFTFGRQQPLVELGLPHHIHRRLWSI